jgi:hypothetical protein
MIIDIRETQDDEIEGIKFDDSGEYIFPIGSAIYYKYGDADVPLIYFEDIDNLIAALKKAKELWG